MENLSEMNSNILRKGYLILNLLQFLDSITRLIRMMRVCVDRDRLNQNFLSSGVYVD